MDNHWLNNNNLTYINNNIDINTKTKSNSDKDIIDSNFLKKNSKINIENVFQQVQDQTAYKRLIKKVLQNIC